MQTHGKIRRYDSKVNAISRLADSGIILLTFFAAIDLFDVEWQSIYVWVMLFSIMLFNFFAESQDAYRSWRGTYLGEEIQTILFSWVTSIFLLILVDLLILKQQIYTQPFIAVWILLTPIELISWHAIVRMLLGFMRSKGFNTRKVAILGATAIGLRLEQAFKGMDWSGFRFVGYYDDRDVDSTRYDSADESALERPSSSITGDFNQLIVDCKSGKIDAVYITLALSAEHRIKSMTEMLADTTASVYFVPDLYIFNLLNSRWVDYQGITAISIFETPFSGVNSLIKRIEDILLSILILCLIAGPMLFIAAGVKFTSKGPVFFKQTRYGMDGEKIRVWKFRSMTVMDDGTEISQVTKNDVRITKFGAFLRRTSLDELPQFFNSLSGEMSIVGPRPHAVAHNEEYRTKIQGYMLRHKVKPGITGLAQINGFRGETDTLDKMEGRVHYDLKYIQTWSLMLDLKIIFMTVFKGFKHKNAY
ncbi:MAG: putative colanic acid biosynthesis UDP-glucose lipid carrier transferase [Oleiphilaceae bacterium]|jgi:putative colanic acid biosynthesis UDP-glucose lipid carrier transferase